MITAMPAGLAIPFALLAQDARDAAPGVLDLSVTPTPRRPLLIEIVQEFDGNYVMKTDGQRTEQPNQSKLELELIDELSSWDEQSAAGTRLFVKAFKMVDGSVEDPPLNGLATMFERSASGSSVKLAESRFLPKNEADALVRMVPGAWLWLPLPREARVGQDHEIDLTSIAALLLSNEVQRSSGSMKALVESFDAATGIAKLRGTAHLEEEGTVKGLDIHVTYVCDGALEVDTRDRRIRSITLSGTYTAEGGTADGRVEYEEQGRYRASLTTQLGDAVAKARQKQVRFRDRMFRIPSLGISVVLPSCYSKVDDPGSQNVFRRLLKGDHLAMISLDYLEGDTRNAPAYHDSLLAKLKREFGTVSTEKVSSPLGAGMAYLFNSQVFGASVKIRSEVYALGERFLLLKLQADPDTFLTALPELVKARKSLARLKG